MSKTYLSLRPSVIALATFAVISFGSIPPVRADTPASIQNLDDKSYKIVVEEDDVKRELTIGPKEQLNDVCKSICLFELEGEPDAYELAKNDIVVIEEGQILYEGADDDESSDDDDTSDDDTSVPDEPEPNVE